MNYITILCSLFFIINSQKYSSLQILGYDINLTPLQSGNYSLVLKIPIQSDDVSSIIYCWKKMKTQNEKGNQNCDLIQDETSYRCIQVNYTRIPAGQKSDNNGSLVNYTEYFETKWTELVFSVSNGFSQTGNSSKNIQALSPDSISRTVNLYNEYLQNFSIYHMITGLSREMIQTYGESDTQAKLSYVHTFVFGSYSNTLIAQRQYYCILYKNKIVYIFEGTVYRGGLLHYFTGILTTTDDNSPFHMWGGYSYSSGHAARDMVGYESTTQNFYDLYSLYAAAPFEDVADNVQGKKNIVRISNSGQSSTGAYPFHFIQFYRLFDTADTNADEIIRDKIYNRFCFAAYFQNYSSQVSQYDLTVLSNSFKHQLIDCHIPDLTLYDKDFLVAWIFALVTLICLLF